MMAKFLLISVALWLSLPPLVLFIKIRRGEKMPWKRVILLVALGGWVLVNCILQLHYQSLEMEYEAAVGAKRDELLEELTNDTAQSTAVLFGWAYSLIYMLPWLAVYAGIEDVRKRKAKESNSC